MAPNPIMIPRKPLPRRSQGRPSEARNRPSLIRSALATAAVAVALVSSTWGRNWILSGAGIETVITIYGAHQNNRILPTVPLWSLLATLNLAYAVCSTSWLLSGIFAVACHGLVALTALSQFPSVALVARRFLRRVVQEHSHFVKDKLALFNLPALEIDTNVDGLFVIRGLTISFSTLTIVAHGIELGLKLADDIELAIYVDEVHVALFRRIEIGDVYANMKGGKFEMTFAEIEDATDDAASEDSVLLLDNTPLLRAATVGSKSFEDRPKLRQSLTGVSYIRDSSAQAGLNIITTLSPDDALADTDYHEKLNTIRTTSAVYQSRAAVRHRAKAENIRLDDEKNIRAAVSAELHNLPSVPHPPQRSIRVTTLQQSSPPYVRRFLHRLPFLLRLLLAPLSYFHPISIASINAAGSGQWLSVLLQQKVFKTYIESNGELRRLHRRISRWLADANFCLQLTDIEAMGQVPLSSSFDIVTWLRIPDVIAYRTVPLTKSIDEVLRLGGADATFTIPSFLLPHHEHIVPPKPTAEDEEELECAAEETDSVPKKVQARRDLKQLRRDEANILMSVHASLPASCDQSLLNFIAALVKATKIIELEKEADEAETASDNTEPATPTSPIPDPDSTSIHSRSKSQPLNLKDVAGFKIMAKNIRQNLRDGSTGANIKEFARDLGQTTRDNMKKTMIGGLVNDRWIAKLVGKTAAMLQKAQGDVGYSGNLPIQLSSYRGEEGLASKILP